MIGIGDRIKKIRMELDLKQGKFAERIEISQGMLSDIEHGNKPLTDRNIKLICLTFGVNEDWLRTGRGPMFSPPPVQPPPPAAPVIIDDRKLEPDEKVPGEEDLLEIFRSFSQEGRKMVLEYAELILKNEKAMRGEPEKGDSIGIGPQEEDKNAE